MSKQHCIHLSSLTLRIDEATIQVILSRYWLRSGTGTSDVTSVRIRGLLHVKLHHVTYPMREPLQGVG